MGFFDKVGGILGSVGNFASGNFVGGVLGLGSTLLSNKSSKQEAQANRDWQANMSDTSIQRRMEDLRKAGLNPLLAVGSASAGASTPSGAVADIKKVDPSFITAISNAIAVKKNNELVDKEKELKDAEINNVNADTANKEADTINKSNESLLFDYKKKSMELQNRFIEAQILSQREYTNFLRADTQSKKMEIIAQGLRNKGIEFSNRELEITVQMLEVEKNSFANSTTAKNIDYWMNKAEQGVGMFGTIMNALKPGATITTETKSYDPKNKTQTKVTESRKSR